MGKPLGNPRLEKMCTELRNNPQQALQILYQHGLTAEKFVALAKELLSLYTSPKAYL
jgi:hypothetical protein